MAQIRFGVVWLTPQASQANLKKDQQGRLPFMQGNIYIYMYGWLSKLWSLFGYPKY